MLIEGISVDAPGGIADQVIISSKDNRGKMAEADNVNVCLCDGQLGGLAQGRQCGVRGCCRGSYFAICLWRVRLSCVTCSHPGARYGM